MIPFVVDARTEGKCYGKYLKSRIPDYIPDDEVTVLSDKSDFGDYEVIDWRYM